MTVSLIVALALAVLIGVSLGTLGRGGSIILGGQILGGAGRI